MHNQLNKKSDDKHKIKKITGSYTSKNQSPINSVKYESQSIVQKKTEKNTKDGEYTLIIDDKAFVKEAMSIFDYLKSQNLIDQFLNKEIHIQKAQGTKEQVCHHWSFGGLMRSFNLNINDINAAFGGTLEESEFGPEIPGPPNWANLKNSDGLDKYGDTKRSKIKIYDQSAHSSRLQSDGIWWHKFPEIEYIFGIKGGDQNFRYSDVDEIRVNVLNSALTSAKSKFSYVKKWNTLYSKNQYDHTNNLLGRNHLDRSMGSY